MRYKILSPEVEGKLLERYLRETNAFPFCAGRKEDIERLYRWAKYNTDVTIEEENE